MELRRVNQYTYDCFIGNQWDTWSRVRQGRSSTFVMQGEKLPKPLLKHLHEILHPQMPISPGQSLDEMLFNNNAINTR